MRIPKFVLITLIIMWSLPCWGSIYEYTNLFNLNGPVKRATFVTNVSFLGFPEDERTLEFTPGGLLLEFEENGTQYSTSAGNTIVKNLKNGDVIRERRWFNGKKDLVERFTSAAPDMLYLSEPTYAPNGDMTGEDITIHVGGDEYESKARYTVLEKDSYGNWTKRKATIQGFKAVNSIETCRIEYYTPQEIEEYNQKVRALNEARNRINDLNQTLAMEVNEIARLETAIDEEAVYDTVEQMPEFVGGAAAMYRFIAKNQRYPLRAAENGEQGRVIVNVIIDKDGSLMIVDTSGVKSEDLIKEAKRIVGKMPPFKPGSQNGRTVRVKYSIPITFKLT